MITYRMPYWFPCFLCTLIAFAVSIKPAMTLPTLPAESGLQNISPLLAIGAFTACGFVFGAVLTWALVSQSNTETNETVKK